MLVANDGKLKLQHSKEGESLDAWGQRPLIFHRHDRPGRLPPGGAQFLHVRTSRRQRSRHDGPTAESSFDPGEMRLISPLSLTFSAASFTYESGIRSLRSLEVTVLEDRLIGHRQGLTGQILG